MGPVTLAGDIAQAHAETMVGVALGQLTRPGSPAIYGNFLSSMALRSGSPTFGTPEPAIGLARRRARWPAASACRCAARARSPPPRCPTGRRCWSPRCPCRPRSCAAPTSSSTPPAGSRAASSWGTRSSSIDADFCGALHTYLQGLDLSEDQFAIDGFHEVGPGKHFFGAQHTLRHYETAFWDSWTADSSSFEQWREAGERRVEDRAADKLADLLAAYQPPPIEPAVDEALRDFVARRKAEVPDMWH